MYLDICFVDFLFGFVGQANLQNKYDNPAISFAMIALPVTWVCFNVRAVIRAYFAGRKRNCSLQGK